MKKHILYILAAVAALILLLPFYYQNVITVIIRISAPDGTYADVSYKPAQASTFIHAWNFIIEKEQTLVVTINKKSISSIKLNIGHKSSKKIEVQYLKFIGIKKTTITPPFDPKNINLGKRNDIFIFDDFPPIEAKKIFYISSFLFCTIGVILFFFVLSQSRNFQLLSAATAGYIGFALNSDLKFAQLNPFLGILIVSFLFIFYRRLFSKYEQTEHSSPKSFFPALLISGLVFGTLNLLSARLCLFNSWKFVVNYPLQMVLGIIGQAIFFYAVGISFFKWISNGSFFQSVRTSPILNSVIDFYNRRTVLCSFLIIILFWLPYHFIYYPGFFPWTSKGQIKQIWDYLPKSQNQPVLSTLLFGLFFNAGNELKNMNLGFYFYTAFQSCACALVFALCMDRIKRLGFNFYYQSACLFFFAVYPIGGLISLWDTKETLYSAVVTFFVLHTFSLVYFPQRSLKARVFILYGVAFLLACLLHQSGIFVTLSTSLAILFPANIPLPVKKKIFAFSLLSTSLFLTLNQYIFPLYGYDKVSKKEALSIPFQQTARYLKKYPEDLSAEERKIIEEVLDISKMTKKYSPFNADFTKSAYKIKNDPNENKKLAAYLKTTVKMFFRHPLTALQATMANSFGYYAFTPYFIIEQKEPFDRQLYTAYPKSTQPLRDFLETFYQDKTVSSLLYTGLRPPVYTWLLVLLGLSFISIKRSKHLLLLVPSAMSVLICIASPINGLLRYMLPVIMSMPIVFSFCLAVYFKEERATENQ